MMSPPKSSSMHTHVQMPFIVSNSQINSLADVDTHEGLIQGLIQPKHSYVYGASALPARIAGGGNNLVPKYSNDVKEN